MSKNNFYEVLQDIVRDTFGPININVEAMSPDKYGRGGNANDIVYAMVSSFKRIMPYDEFEAKKSFLIIRSIKLATYIYCQEHNLPDYSDSLLVSINNEPCAYVFIEMKYKDVDESLEIKYTDSYSKDELFNFITLTKEDNEIENIVPRFIKKNFAYEDLKKSAVLYLGDNKLSVEYLKDNKEEIKESDSETTANSGKRPRLDSNCSFSLDVEIDCGGDKEMNTKVVKRFEISGTVEEAIEKLKEIADKELLKPSDMD